MRAIKVPYSATGRFSGIVTDYLSDHASLRPFYRYRPQRDSFEEVIGMRKKFPVDRKVLTAALIEQYRKFAPELSGEVNPLISSLADDNTFTITTGHQLNLFTGPLYSIYKIATAIKIAKSLAQDHPQYRFVPVFWMATEDHDFEEIASVNIGESGFNWNPGLPPVACGTIPTSGFDAFAAEVASASGETALFWELKECYASSADLSQATRRMVHKLFEGQGLVVMDGNDREFKSLFVKEMLDDAFSHNAFLRVSESAAKLEKSYKVQVTPREINLFYLEDKNRGRIIPHPESGFEVSGSQKTFTADTLEAEIRGYPERFSPNVVLRPLYQEKILPNLAYVGGPGELAYWLELESMFTHYHVSFPVLMPRCSFMYIDQSVARKMVKAGMAPEDIFLDREALIKKLIRGTSAVQDAIKVASATVDSSFAGLSNTVSSIDPTLSGSLEAEKQKALKGLSTLEEKLIRAIKRKEETTVTQIDGILEKLFPKGVLQERQQNILAVTPDRTFVDSIVASCDPFSHTFDILLPE